MGVETADRIQKDSNSSSIERTVKMLQSDLKMVPSLFLSNLVVSFGSQHQIEEERSDQECYVLDLSMKKSPKTICPNDRKRPATRSINSSSDESDESFSEKSDASFDRKFENSSKSFETKFEKSSKISRILKLDQDRVSPVSGEIILDSIDYEGITAIRRGDIDPEFNIVEVTEEAKAELARIENRIGDFICQLCKEIYQDAFGLAQHRCSRIVLLEYRCPECDKVFNCPANLASHRRWHRPQKSIKVSPTSSKAKRLPCKLCLQVFTDKTSLKKHQEVLHNNSKSEVGNVSGNISGQASLEVLICQVCTKKFKSLPDLVEHRTSQHSDTFPCTVCTEIFYSLAGLTRHCNRFHNFQS